MDDNNYNSELEPNRKFGNSNKNNNNNNKIDTNYIFKRLKTASYFLIASIFILGIPFSIFSFYMSYQAQKLIDQNELTHAERADLKQRAKLLMILSCLSFVLNFISLYLMYPQLVSQYQSMLSGTTASSGNTSSIWG